MSVRATQAQPLRASSASAVRPRTRPSTGIGSGPRWPAHVLCLTQQACAAGAGPAAAASGLWPRLAGRAGAAIGRQAARAKAERRFDQGAARPAQRSSAAQEQLAQALRALDATGQASQGASSVPLAAPVSAPLSARQAASALRLIGEAASCRRSGGCGRHAAGRGGFRSAQQVQGIPRAGLAYRFGGLAQGQQVGCDTAGARQVGGSVARAPASDHRALRAQVAQSRSARPSGGPGLAQSAAGRRRNWAARPASLSPAAPGPGAAGRRVALARSR